MSSRRLRAIFGVGLVVASAGGFCHAAEPVGRSGPARYSPLDLQPLANQKRADDFHQTNLPGNNLADLAAGEHRLLGVPFRVGDGVLQLGCKSLTDKPNKIAGIKVGRPFARLYILHATGYAVDEADVAIARYVVHYADGQTATIPVVNGKDVCGWWKRAGAADPTDGKVAWEGTNDCVARMATTVRLFVSTWKNPRPTVPVIGIDYISTMTKCAPFCVALTAEQPLRPRAAASPPTPEDLDRLWQRLAADGDPASDAIEALAGAAELAVPFLAGRVAAARPAADEKRIADLIRQLDDEAFAVRDRATRDLQELGPDAVPALGRALAGSPSPEVRGRLQHLVDHARRGGLSEPQRRLRGAVWALEVAATPDARRALADVARGGGERWLADEARESLKRLAEPGRRAP